MSLCSTVIGFHVSRTRDFYNSDLHFALARPEDWGEDIEPPTSDSQLQDPFLYKSVDNKLYVVRDDENGSIDFHGTKWRVVAEKDIYDEGCRWLYLTATIDPREAPQLSRYSQVGLVTHLKVKDGVTNAYLTPDDLDEQPVLEVLDNRGLVTMDSSLLENLRYIIEF